MTKEKSQSHEKDKGALDTLLRLPRKNLEERVARLQSEIASREDLSRQLISEWDNKQARLNDRIDRLCYTSQNPLGFQARKDAESQVSRLQDLRTRELASSFRDLLDLRERLETAREELDTEKHKLELLDS